MFVGDKFVKRTRKPHTCEFCGRVIDVGESALNCFCVDGSDVHGYYLCGWCMSNMSSVTDEQEFIPGELYEHVLNALDRPKCESCGNDDIDIDLNTKCGNVILKCNECANIWQIDLATLFEQGGNT